MKRVVFVLLAMVVAGCCTTGKAPDSSSGSAGGATQADDAKQLIPTLIEQYNQALMKKDIAALERLWADDLIFINLRGQAVTKAQRLENVRTGSTTFRSIDVAELNIRQDGDVALCIARVTLNARYSGQEGSGAYRVAMVWTHPRGTWQMSLIQMTRIQE